MAFIDRDVFCFDTLAGDERAGTATWDSDELSPCYMTSFPQSALKRAPAAASDPDKPSSTTVMIKNIPCRFTQEDAKRVLDASGLRGKFDWIYMPRSPTMQTNLGYAFVNFRLQDYVDECRLACHGRPFGNTGSLKLAEVAPAHMQGGVQSLMQGGKGAKGKNRAVPLFVHDPLPAWEEGLRTPPPGLGSSPATPVVSRATSERSFGSPPPGLALPAVAPEATRGYPTARFGVDTIAMAEELGLGLDVEDTVLMGDFLATLSRARMDVGQGGRVLLRLSL